MTDIKAALTEARTIAVVGYSANPARPSHDVAHFLKSKGYRVIPVNPGLEGQEHLGERVYGDLASIPFDVDMVDVFRRSEAVPAIVEEALRRWPRLQTIWTQLGVIDETAAMTARARGVRMVMNRCPKIEWPRVIEEAKSVTDFGPKS